MPSTSVPQRISNFLHRRSGRVYCDTCIGERLGLKWRQQVQLITATLGVTQEFERSLWECCTCKETKLGIKTAQPLSADAPKTAQAGDAPNEPVTRLTIKDWCPRDRSKEDVVSVVASEEQ